MHYFVYTKWIFTGKFMEMNFEWDLAKAESNLRKHGIRFETAALVFEDPFHLSVQDRIENTEYRW